MTYFSVVFNRVVQALGRNGYMKQIAINMDYDVLNKQIILYPVNSRGDYGRCQLNVPLEHLDEFIQKLQNLKNSIP